MRARFHQSRYLGFDDLGDVPEQVRPRWIVSIGEARLEADGRILAGAGHGYLEWTRRVSLHERCLVLGQPPQLPQLATHHLPRALLVRFTTRALPHANHRGVVGLNVAFHRLNQVVLKPGTPKFPIGIDLHSRCLLTFQDAQDCRVFDSPQLVQFQRAFAVVRPGLVQIVGTQQTPYVIGAVNFRHDSVSLRLLALPRTLVTLPCRYGPATKRLIERWIRISPFVQIDEVAKSSPPYRSEISHGIPNGQDRIGVYARRQPQNCLHFLFVD